MTREEILVALVGDVVVEMKESADETLADEKHELNFGKLLGYAEALSSIKRAFENEPYIQKMLDFDIDEKYLYGK